MLPPLRVEVDWMLEFIHVCSWQIPGQVKVHYTGYETTDDAWVSIDMLKCKAFHKPKKARHSGRKELIKLCSFSA